MRTLIVYYSLEGNTAFAAEKIAGRYGAKAAADRNIVLGGLIFKYPEKGIYIDLTLDTAFENERSAFSARSEMQL